MNYLELYNSLFQEPTEIITPNGVNLKTSIIDDGNNAIEIALADSVKVLISQYEKELKEVEKLALKIGNIAKIEKKINRQLKEKHKKELEKIEKQREYERKEYEKALHQNKLYKERYGTLVDPDDLIIEFYNNGSIGQWGLLIPPSRWKKKLHGDKGTIAKRYWISIFRKLNIIEVWSGGKYRAKVPQKEALEILHKHLIDTGAITIDDIKAEEKTSE